MWGRNGGVLEGPGHTFSLSQVLNWSWGSSGIFITQAGNTVTADMLKSVVWQRYLAVRNSGERKKLAPQTPKWLLNLLCAASLTEGFLKDFQVPLLSCCQHPAELADDSSLSPFPRRTSVGGTERFTLPQKQKERERRGGARGWHMYPKKPSSCAGLSPSTLHTPTSPSSASSFPSRHTELHKLSISRLLIVSRSLSLG